MDEIGNANLFDGTNQVPCENRYGLPKTAIRLREGFLKVPTGVYFSSDFTVTAWVKIYSIQNMVRILDFGKGTGSDNIIISIGFEGSSILTFWIFNEDRHSFVKSVTSLKLNYWTHVSVVLNGNIARP